VEVTKLEAVFAAKPFSTAFQSIQGLLLLWLESTSIIFLDATGEWAGLEYSNFRVPLGTGKRFVAAGLLSVAQVSLPQPVGFTFVLYINLENRLSDTCVLCWS
jgi:hypothetical protein